MAKYNAPQGEGWNQAKQRSVALFFDQHRSPQFPDGRPWWAYVERPADGAAQPMPVMELVPYGWDAPWLPEAKYMQMSLGALSGNRFRIAYERMITDYRVAMDEYYVRAAEEAVSANLTIPDHGEPISWKLQAIVGKPPKSPRLPEAALAGDRWLLGFSKEPNEQLERLIVTGHAQIATPHWTPIHELPSAERQQLIDDAKPKGKRSQATPDAA